MNQGGRLFTQSQLIGNLQVGEKVDWYYRVLENAKKKKKDGGDFLTLLLMDKSGRMPGKIWDNAEKYQQIIQNGAIYRVVGEVTEYNQKRELRIARLSAISGNENDFDASNYQEAAPFDTEAVFKQTREILQANISNPFLVRLIDQFFLGYGDALKNHPGAQKIHHAYPGGLLEHTHCLLKLALPVAELYALDKELLLVGALFHDIGKTGEFQVQPAPETTMAGGLLGHIIIGAAIFQELAKRIEDFPQSLALKIQHLIVSHHGEKEFGSPEVPRIPEAYALHMLDLLDSRLNIFGEIARGNESKGLFSDFHHTLGTRILLERE